MSVVSRLIQRHWQKPRWWLSLLLLPLSWLFAVVVGLRRFLYQKKIRPSQKLAVPVVIVGNINVGGVGKTPVLMSLIHQLTQRSIKVGVMSRGYGRTSRGTLLVHPEGSAGEYGDEPLMIAQKTGVPVAVSGSRYEAGMCLLQTHPDLDIILSDDGLQHYALQRDIELVVVSQKLKFGNGSLLPQGPLREPISRLHTANALVLTDGQVAEQPELLEPLKTSQLPVFDCTLTPAHFYPLNQPRQQQPATAFTQNNNIVALAGIGAPQKFFDTLHSLGIIPKHYLSFPDHHDYYRDDIPDGFDFILTTEKDAVKLRTFDLANVWIVPVDATIKPDLGDWLIRQLQLN